jgi:hypothetical protein
LIGVFPPKIDSIQSEHKTVIEVKFDKELDLIDISKICFLQNKEKLDQVVSPERILRNGQLGGLNLYFNLQHIEGS